MKVKLKNAIMIAAGTLALMLGAIGMFFPIWPTTPFVLIAVALYGCSPRLRAKILEIKFIAEYYNSYKSGAGLPTKTVCLSLILLWLTLTVSGLIMAKLWSTILFACVGIGVSIHILCIAKPRGGRHTAEPGGLDPNKI